MVCIPRTNDSFTFYILRKQEAFDIPILHGNDNKVYTPDGTMGQIWRHRTVIMLLPRAVSACAGLICHAVAS